MGEHKVGGGRGEVEGLLWLTNQNGRVMRASFPWKNKPTQINSS